MTSPTTPARVPILDENDRLPAEFLPAVPPSGWGGGTGTATPVTGATTTVAGVVELATTTEARDGTSTSVVVTPAGVRAAITAVTGTPDVPWYPRVGGIATNPIDLVSGSWPPHPVTASPEQVYVFIGAAGRPNPTTDGNRLTGGGGMDVVRQPPDRLIAL